MICDDAHDASVLLTERLFRGTIELEAWIGAPNTDHSRRLVGEEVIIEPGTDRGRSSWSLAVPTGDCERPELPR
jgi:hypothetical protein